MSGSRTIRVGSEVVCDIGGNGGGVIVLNARVLGVNIKYTKADARISKVLADGDLDCGKSLIRKEVSPGNHGKHIHSGG